MYTKNVFVQFRFMFVLFKKKKKKKKSVKGTSAFNGNKVQIYYMMVKIAAAQSHICAKAIEQFHIFFS